MTDGTRPALKPTASAPLRGKKRIALWGNFGVGNLGNECTLHAMVAATRRHAPNVELSCICRGPGDAERRHGIAGLPITPWPETASRRRGLRFLLTEALGCLAAVFTLLNKDALVVVGTGMLSDLGEGTRGLPWLILKWSLAAKLTGTPLLFVSVGVEQIDKPLSRLFFRTALHFARYRSYRDELSKDRLVKLDFKVDTDPVFPDLAFGLEPPDAEQPPQGIAIGLYDFQDEHSGSRSATNDTSYLDKLVTLVKWAKSKGAHVRIVVGDLRYDLPVLKQLERRLREQGIDPESVASSLPSGVEELLAQLAEVEIVVASRFHNVLLSLLQGRPVVSVSYDAKNDVLMAQMGLGDYCQRVEDFDVARVAHQVEELRGRAACVAAQLRQKSSDNRQQLERQYRLLFGPEP